jgi:hypothetical protein
VVEAVEVAGAVPLCRVGSASSSAVVGEQAAALQVRESVTERRAEARPRAALTYEVSPTAAVWDARVRLSAVGAAAAQASRQGAAVAVEVAPASRQEAAVARHAAAAGVLPDVEAVVAEALPDAEAAAVVAQQVSAAAGAAAGEPEVWLQEVGAAGPRASQEPRAEERPSEAAWVYRRDRVLPWPARRRWVRSARVRRSLQIASR